MDKVCVRSDEVLESGVKLKEYLTDAIATLTDEYIEITHKAETIPKDDLLVLVQEHRNILLCIKEICKKRNKF